MAKRKVYLVPGFFGFSSLAALNYFYGVKEQLEASLAACDCETEVVRCPTQATGSIPRRAERLCRHVVETGGLDADELHFVGHSTGGLDVRLLLSGTVCTAPSGAEGEIAARTRTAILVATPNHGTPAASFFTSVQGRNVLLLVTLLATSEYGRSVLTSSAQLMGLIARLDDPLGRTDSFLDKLSERLLRTVTKEPDDPVWRFLEEVATDQGALFQLTPESMHLFGAAVADNPGVRYSCVVAGVPRPRFRIRLRDLTNPGRVLMEKLFATLYRVTARPHPHYPYPLPNAPTLARLERDLGFSVDAGSSDGVVPTLSQIHSQILHAARGDHLDLVGQFPRPDDPMSDWLPSGAHFCQEDFERLWWVVAKEIAA